MVNILKLCLHPPNPNCGRAEQFTKTIARTRMINIYRIENKVYGKKPCQNNNCCFERCFTLFILILQTCRRSFFQKSRSVTARCCFPVPWFLQLTVQSYRLLDVWLSLSPEGLIGQPKIQVFPIKPSRTQKPNKPDYNFLEFDFFFFCIINTVGSLSSNCVGLLYTFFLLFYFQFWKFREPNKI